VKTERLALHGETFGTITRMPDNTAAGFGPSYSSDPKGPGFVCYVLDSHWPQFFLIRAADLDEAYEHALICLCPIDDDLEQELADRAPTTQYHDDPTDHEDFYNLAEDLCYQADATHCADGRVRTSHALRILELDPRSR
jgi:hypothetical protein